MRYVTDTHCLLWFLLKDNSKLSEKAKEIFENAEEGNYIIIIPSIVLLELMRILEKRNLKNKFNQIIKEIEEIDNYEIHSLDINIIKKVSEIKKIGELHDGIIIATAKLVDLPLITKDEEITKSKEAECIW